MGILDSNFGKPDHATSRTVSTVDDQAILRETAEHLANQMPAATTQALGNHKTFKERDQKLRK